MMLLKRRRNGSKMVMKKEVLKELQKFNDDLNKHLPELNLDFLQNKEVFSKEENMNELVPLLANNLMDLKTEIALIRKNLVDSVEGMVLRVISEQQKSFANQMDRMFTQMLVEMKGNFSSYITEVSNDMGLIKKDVDKLHLKTDNLSSKLDIFDNKIVELTASTDEIKNLRSNISTVVNKEVDSIKSEILKIDSNLMNNINKKFIEMGRKYTQLEETMKTEKLLLSNESTNDIELIDEIIEDEDDFNKLEINIANSGDNLQKLISIEDRIRKLDSLK